MATVVIIVLITDIISKRINFVKGAKSVIYCNIYPNFSFNSSVVVTGHNQAVA